MSRVVMYSTEPCGFCRTAKTLLNARGIPFEEINLAKDPDGRAALAAETGRMTFPQIVIDGANIGGFQELARLDGAGRLRELVEAEAA
jgi:glutaredoxin 3